jgi:hypothetical protein
MFFYLFLPINLGYKGKGIKNFEFTSKICRDLAVFEVFFFRSLAHSPKAHNEFYIYIKLAKV